MNQKPIELFGISLDPLTREEATERIVDWTLEKEFGRRFVVTPNVDHLVRLERDALLRNAYASAALVLTDGKPVRWAANLLGKHVPCTVPGSDLVPLVLARLASQKRPMSVFLFGGPPGSAERAAEIIRSQYGPLLDVRYYCPPMGFDQSATENAAAIKAINAQAVDLLVIGLGMPKQEKWIAANSARLTYKVALCVGATIEFVAGVKKRAPAWMQAFGLEWLYRALQEPRRLGRRYAVDAIVFPKLVVKEWWKVARPFRR